jgi:anaerobic magnesium-protoporphyrin IX monomethyl ester cyclase
MGVSVLLVLPIREGDNVAVLPDLGLLYLGTALRSKGVDVTLLDCPKEGFTFADFKRLLEEKRFGVVGLRCFTRDHNYVKHHVRIAKQVNPEAVTLAGGPHPSALAEYVLRDMPALDYCWESEAEDGLPQLLDYVGQYGRAVPEELLKTVPGLVWRGREDQITVNPPSFGGDLDAYGQPGWDMLAPDTYPGFIWGGQHYPIITTRGCPYPCAYCNVPGLSGKKLRHRSVEHVLDELRLLKERYQARTFSIMDDEFTLDRNYALRLSEALIESGLGLKFDCPLGVRLDSLTPELVRTMEAAGCETIAVGVESGNERVLTEIKKKVSVETLREKAAMVAASSKIAMVGYFMLGFEDETEEEIWDTINLALELPLAHANFNIVIPIPGAAIFDDCLRSGLIHLDQINWDRYTSDQIAFHRRHITDERLLALRKQAYLRFYRRPRLVWRLSKETLSNRAVVGASFRKLRGLLRRRRRRDFTPLYLREAIN